MKIIAVIPARGGSKRIPKKNIIDFMGKPILAWTIEAARKSKIFDRIILSTDSEDIASVGREFGIDVPFLRTDKSDDISPVTEATIVAVKQAERFYNEKYDVVVQLMANAPLRNENDIKNHFNFFIDSKSDFQISSFKFGWMNPWWSFKLNQDGTSEWMLKEGINKRSQDLEDLYCPTGVIWIAKVDKLIESNTFYGPGYKFCEIDWKHAVDIDNYEDLEFAKALFMLK
ncbi:cytidylyltransferase domain-containing protein [Flavobacterium sp. GT3P67]|uniref:acylneuraminate cytidylyltransferase family protein n=1 Tax=Flavobacterium sp. GT3P67 TaxID=2541722 RepID=UPI00104A6023|nr:acylneuraminate cytidylyltransferase family protein [Flavobacterium sp. GT3P67]TDE51304.1 acylneuraminate cytidylyltransferase family protein [Flavobacterium sp. GT3P67]